jgi:hypothetical protein
MSKFSFVWKLLGVVGAVLLIGGLVGWLGSRRPSALEASAPLAGQTGLKPGTSSRPDVISVPPSLERTQRSRHFSPGSGISAAAATPQPANLLTNWEDRVEQILGNDDTDEAQKAKQMLQIFSRLPEDGQVEVAQHLSNLVSDQDYAGLAALTADGSLPEAVLDVLLSDVLNRPNSLKLPLLLDIARNDQHPKAPEAKDLLELFLEEDYGKDWNKWQAGVQQWLQNNPD